MRGDLRETPRGRLNSTLIRLPTEMRNLILLVIVVVLGWQGLQHFRAATSHRAPSVESSLSAVPAQVAPPASSASFKCDGRIYCSQMTSCEEATYFLRTCPGTKMDGNNDGVPCEIQWCNR